MPTITPRLSIPKPIGTEVAVRASINNALDAVDANAAKKTDLDNHLTATNNPHAVTAAQVGALKSVDGVVNNGGDVDLVQGGAITITPDNVGKKITISENHSAQTNNPHVTTAAQVGALVSIDGVSNGGGNVDLVPGGAITITPDNTAAKKITISESHSARTDNPHGTTAAQVGAIANAANAVTDAIIGSRTIDDTVASTGNVGTLANLFSWIGNMLKAVTGEVSWRTAPATTLKTAKAHIDRVDNPHAVTAAQVGAMPVGGGTFTGDISATSVTVNGAKYWGKLANAPATTNAGDFYFDSTLSKYRFYDGAGWANYGLSASQVRSMIRRL